jgi:ketosteroid isomerase-like protein
MSQENVEIWRRSQEAFTRRDRTTWLALFDEDVELVPDRNWPEPGVRGADAVWDYYMRIIDAFDQFPTDKGEAVDAGSDKVLVHERHDLSGKGSSAEVEFDYWAVLTIRQGKIRRVEWFVNRAEALEAAGLSE